MDSHLRELERRASASGSLADRVEVLRARLRGGAITPDRLQLAAFCNHEAAIALSKPPKHLFDLQPNQNHPSWRAWKNLFRSSSLGKRPVIAVCYIAVARAYQSDTQLQPEEHRWLHRTEWDVPKLLDAVLIAANGGPSLSFLSEKYKHGKWITYANEAADWAVRLLWNMAKPNQDPFWTSSAKVLRRSMRMYCAIEMELAIPDYYPGPTQEQEERGHKLQEDRRVSLTNEIRTIMGQWAAGDIDSIPKLH